MALYKELGGQGGIVYEKHRHKIECVSGGYMADGNVRHYIRVKPSKKFNRYKIENTE